MEGPLEETAGAGSVARSGRRRPARLFRVDPEARERFEARLIAGERLLMRYVSIGNGTAFVWLCPAGHAFQADFLLRENWGGCRICEWGRHLAN